MGKNEDRMGNYLVDDLLEVHFDGRLGIVREFRRVMDKFAEFVQSHPFGSLTEHKQKTFYRV